MARELQHILPPIESHLISSEEAQSVLWSNHMCEVSECRWTRFALGSFVSLAAFRQDVSLKESQRHFSGEAFRRISSRIEQARSAVQEFDGLSDSCLQRLAQAKAAHFAGMWRFFVVQLLSSSPRLWQRLVLQLWKCQPSPSRHGLSFDVGLDGVSMDLTSEVVAVAKRRCVHLAEQKEKAEQRLASLAQHLSFCCSPQKIIDQEAEFATQQAWLRSCDQGLRSAMHTVRRACCEGQSAELRARSNRELMQVLRREATRASKNLPVFAKRAELLDVLQQCDAVVYTAETGSGKSTQV
eukprot:CAMPEP_0204249864 /NCGR_PEP_ID=MMETSP0361-20130328/99877_1 /ASSEMBLY_ACC=CAM_ASM_000343 /TAXON_ID=268821 /ORGANISM="Scrippsiella Hangoei, Strain SHTV-5" /LENGTH=296 /DNA_ID=CAMNT_0051223133 /DNA_START=108 /DNA_END=995 /DNA_ORIENTATION=-